jgi:hypothetical protein
MADMEPQINQLPGNSFPYSTRQNHVLGDASVRHAFFLSFEDVMPTYLTVLF